MSSLPPEEENLLTLTECQAVAKFIAAYWVPSMLEEFAEYLQEYLTYPENSERQSEEYRFLFLTVAKTLCQTNGRIITLSTPVREEATNPPGVSYP